MTCPKEAYIIEKDASCYTKTICTANYSFNYALKQQRNLLDHFLRQRQHWYASSYQ